MCQTSVFSPVNGMIIALTPESHCEQDSSRLSVEGLGPCAVCPNDPGYYAHPGGFDQSQGDELEAEPF